MLTSTFHEEQTPKSEPSCTPSSSRLCFGLMQRMSGDEEEKHIGTGGMADTRDPEPTDDPDPRKSISAAPTFEEYMKQKKAEAEGK